MIHTMNTTYRSKKRVTRMMARCSQGVAKVYPRCTQALAILMSKLRSSLGAAWEQPGSSLEYAYSMLMTTFLRPFSSKRAELERRLAANEITARPSRDYGSCPTRLRLVMSMLLMLTVGSSSVWGQDGFWYIANDKGLESETSFDYNTSTTAERFYIVPAKDPVQAEKRDAYYSENYDTSDGDPEKPYLTTYRTNRDVNSAWVIKSAGNSKYFLIHALTGKYAVYNTTPDCVSKSKPHRKVIHLETLAVPENVDNAKFYIENGTTTYTFRPQSLSSGNRYFNPSNGNMELYHANGGDCNNAGLIGVFNEANNRGSKWHIEEAQLTAPTISNVDDNNIVTVTDANGLPDGYNIRYTTDGSTPTASSPILEGKSYMVTSSVTLKAVVERYGIVLTEVAEKAVAPAPCATPVITFDYTTSNVSISCTTPNSTIYYTTDGSIPTTSSTAYSAPFSVDGPTTVKAFATHTTKDPSAVAELAITQVGTPTIQNNGNNAISITTTTPDATIYYTTDGSTPTTASSVYSSPLTDNVSNVTIKAIAVKENMITSTVGSGTVKLQCAMPIITRNGLTFTISCSMPTNATLYYTLGGGSETLYSEPVAFTADQLPTTVTAVARHSDYTESEVASMYLKTGSGTPEDPYLIYGSADFTNFITNVNNGTTASASYKLGSDVSVSGTNAITTAFTGTFDGNGYTISNLSHPLFNIIDGGVVKNVMLKNVQISGSGNVGAIAGEASGYTRIYNCGILPSDNKYENESSYVSSSDGNCGGLVGLLNDDSRVINCFSYANITGGTTVAGIVGYNNFASTAEETDGKYTKLKTAVVNCMFYGNITGGTTRYPVYGGNKILNNTATGINNYDFYRAEANLGLADNSHYNCSWPAQEEYLTKYEYYRYLLNSNRELCGWWVGAPSAPSGMSTTEVQAVEKDASLMAKWVLDPSIAPYPILKTPGKYYSAINQDPDNRINPVSKAWESRSTSSNTITTKAAPDTEGQKLGSITVNINKGGGLGGSDSKVIPITAMDIDNNDFCYGKIQLPYYNSIFGDPSVEITGTTAEEKKSQWASRYGGNYGDKVVVGWEITSVTGGTEGTLVKNWQDGYNFADRDCTNKDKERIFAQGGYYYVPNGVTAITITAKWADAIYLDNSANNSYDRVYMSGTNAGTDFAPAGHRPTTLGNGKPVQTGTIANNIPTGDVYEKAIVLVGNHQYRVGGADIGNANKGCTIISADFNLDDEPDYCLIWQLGQGTNRQGICPIRLDFLPVIEMGMAMKEDASTQYYSLGCYLPLGHFEVTETSLIHFGQFEFGKLNRTKDAPLILNGGIYDQYCKGTKAQTNAEDHIDYVILGGNVYMPSFSPGAHVNSGAKYPTRHCAVNVLGGRINNLYLTGNFNNGVTPNKDNPHCYIDGGNFKQIAAAGKEGINGDVYFKINHSVINEFYGGSTLADKLVTGKIDVIVDNSNITKYCGGPKFGNMASGKTVTTNATGTTFGVYYGGGNGGTSYVQYASIDYTNPNATSNYNWGTTGGLNGYTPNTYRDGDGNHNYMADYEMEIVNSSAGTDAKKGIFRTYFYAAQFSATNTGPITNNLKDCKVLTSFYGGGNLGGVIGDVESTLTDTEVMGSVFGAGYSASVPEVTIYNKNKTAPTLNVYTGIITPTPDPDPTSTSTTYTWTNKTSLGGQTLSTSNPAVLNVDGVNYFYTEESLENLGTVTGNVTLTINGNTVADENGKVMEVGNSVYGGGEESAVGGNTVVNINGGTIGTDNSGDDYGNVFGGGKLGLIEKNTTVTISGGSVNQSVYGGGCEADVKGNTNVSMTDGYIFNGIYGGGLSGSVGTFTRSTDPEFVNTFFGHTTHEGCIGKPTSCTQGTGKCTIVVSGGQIGPIEVATPGMNRKAAQGGPVPEGWVWGGGRGKVESPNENPDVHFTAYVNETDVTIKENAFILESIIGGGEFGRVLGNTKVNIKGGQIGVGAGKVDANNKPIRYTDNQFVDPNVTPITNENALAPCSHYPYGKVVGGKTIYETYDPYADEYKANHSESLPTGLEGGSTDNASDGKTWIGCVFGGGSGYFPYKDTDANGQITDYGWVESAGWVEGNTEVNISGGHILSNVYGANEYTNVKGKSTVTMTGGTIGVPLTEEQFKECPQLGHLFGGGKGDPRTYFNKRTNVESVEIKISGGIIYGSVYGGGEDGHVIGNVTTTISQASGKTTTIGCGGLSGNDGNVFGGGKGSPTALTAGVIAGNVNLNITGGTIWGSAYGGGQIASVGTSFETPTSPNYGKMQEGDEHGNLTVSLTGGTIHQNVYGGCMGTNADADHGVTEEFAAKLGISKNVSVELNNGVDDADKGCVVLGNIFGCNNVNSSPEGTSTVHIYKTQRNGASRINNYNEVTNAKVIGTKDANGEFVLNTFDVQAVYGGGNLAAYTPKDENGSTNVIIDGCHRTSIGQVYGGGNAASTPATNVLVNGTFEIGELFGGGNGKDAIVVNNVSTPNPGANVGYKDYHLVEDDPAYASKEVRTEGDAFATYRYGTGLATVNIKGGTIHRVFGGSNTKGNVRKTALTMLEEVTEGGEPKCPFCVDEAYGGGKSAPMDAEAKLLMACIPGLNEVYGGAEAADIHDDVTLTITNGKFDRVFGGNNISGTISGKITVNIEETGCKPIVIGELYGGGNLAAYSVYGYKEVNEGTTENPKIVWKPRTSLSDEGTGPSTPYVSPQVNVRSFTSIGAIYGGGYGEKALMIANPTVNISESVGDPDTYPTTGDDYTDAGFKGKTITVDGHEVVLPEHTKNKIGAINNVFGGGNAAPVQGDTQVNIGTAVGEDVYLVKAFKTGDTLPNECYTKNGNNYTEATGTAQEGKTYYRKYPVVGVDIRGNVYGGGNNAAVTGNTNVNIGKRVE